MDLARPFLQPITSFRYISYAKCYQRSATWCDPAGCAKCDLRNVKLIYTNLGLLLGNKARLQPNSISPTTPESNLFDSVLRCYRLCLIHWSRKVIGCDICMKDYIKLFNENFNRSLWDNIEQIVPRPLVLLALLPSQVWISIVVAYANPFCLYGRYRFSVWNIIAAKLYLASWHGGFLKQMQSVV